MGYCTRQEIRDRGVSVTAAADSAVDQAIIRAARIIDATTGQDFQVREATVRLDGSGTASLFLDDYPVIEILDLQVDGTPLPAEAFVCYPEAGYLRLVGARRDLFAGAPGVFPRGNQNITIHGRFGYATVPPAVNEAAILLTLEALRTGPAEADVASGSAASTRHALGIKRVRIDEISVDFVYPNDLKAGAGGKATTGLPAADRLLARFRRRLEPVTV